MSLFYDRASPRMLKVVAAGLLLATTLTTAAALMPALPVQAQEQVQATAIDPTRGFADLVDRVMPAVVSVEVKYANAADTGEDEDGGRMMPGLPEEGPFGEFFKQFPQFRDGQPFHAPRRHGGMAQGSGFIISSDGFAVTNNHVVQDADEVSVTLKDGTEYKADVIGTDPKTDLAVLKIEAENLHTIPWADSDKLEVGEFVLAVGNPFGLNQTVTMGIVSAVGRASMGIAEYEDFIQTDAAINPGNSGGALVNARGELVGINTAIFSQSGGNMGIGFAVPANMARSILDQLVEHGKVVRGWLGVSIQEVSPELASQFGLPEAKGVLVSDVLDDSPAKKAGLERGDVILEFDGKAADSPTQLRNLVAQTPVGKKVSVKFVREKKSRTVDLTIVEQPKSVAQAGSDEGGGSTAPTGLLSDLEVHELNSELTARYNLSSGERGLVVVKVKPGSVADEVGIKEGDLVLEVNRQAVANAKTYERAASRIGKDQPVLLLIKRQGRTRYVTLKP